MTKEDKSFTKFQWFIVIIISILVTVVFIYYMLTIVGIDPLKKVRETASSTPLLSNVVKEEKENNEQLENPDKLQQLEKENKNLTKTVDEQNEMIQALEKDIEIKEKEVQKLSQELKSLHSQRDSNNEEENEPNVDMASIYSKMNPSKASESIVLLSNEEAVEILLSLKQDTVAKILEKMEPKDRAKYTKLLNEVN
ncbi:hypothetical protein [Bacillus sp. FJAT-47783]|uniref:magnesium transporter MgtE N-terminal domain-containing protein n=1 Tax=Bacillus sp. FJAT-47783 TaxID=2922712 RepID=UPI001FACA280|nr:hypothetical protein [Bacillus sp. FJAT-47783]